MRTRFSLLVLLIFGLTPSFAQDEPGDIVDVASGAGVFNTLLTAVGVANLESTLRSEGPFTVFAPTDDAFAEVPAETLDALLADVDALTQVLLYHVVVGSAVPAADVVGLSEVTTANGATLPITVTDDVVMVGDANVIQTDVAASNGIIHVIDSVLIPPAETADIVETAVAAGRFNTLAAALDAAGLVGALQGEGPFTVFAPNDAAFARLPAGTVEALLNDVDALTEILLYHVVSGSLDANAVLAENELTTLGGEKVTISATDAGAFVNDSQIITTDIAASNGIIHEIDSVLIPPEEIQDIIGTAVGAGRFNTLATALEAAGLVDALQGAGPFTVFAPNDAAFAKLPEGTVEALLADVDTLTKILLYHVTPGALEAGEVLSRNQLLMLSGDRAAITTDGDGAYIDDAQIIATDISASNGIIHEIDSVIIPEELMGNTYEVTITNTTKGQPLSPPVIVTHSAEISLWEVGQPATPGIKYLAEEGNADMLIDGIFPNPERFDIVIADGPVLPGESVTLTVKTSGDKRHISVAAMLGITNDTFMGATIAAPRDLAFFKNENRPTVAREKAYAYDAGTEFNSESCDHLPSCGGAGVSPSQPGEGFVHVANGIHGVGDLDAATHTWLGPVAMIKVVAR